jgi:crotonobetainyl-CoA:carnitine CoA-transferase CaiB-like acyl-CoA transferase
MAGPLDGVLVVDLTRVLAGPWCTQILADLGADVVKIERPGTGDDTRDWGPPFLKGAAGEKGDAAYYLGANRNKRSVALDIAAPLGNRAVKELAAKADVFIENFKAGGLKKLGLDGETLRAANRRLVTCSVTGYGQTGPYADRPGYDFIIQGLGGLMSTTGERDDLPGGGPQKVGVAVSDLMTGMYAAIGILAGVMQARATGEGQSIDLGLLDTQVAMMTVLNMNYFVGGKVPGRMGNAHVNIVPYQTFKTSDGHIIVTAGNDSQFRAFCQAAGRSELADNPRFARNSARVANRAELVPVLESIVAAQPSAWWIERLEASGVPCGPINDIAEVWRDPQVIARGMRVDLPHALGVDVASVASPLRLSGTPVAYRMAPPVLGAHTREVLREKLGWTDEQIRALEQEAER